MATHTTHIVLKVHHTEGVERDTCGRLDWNKVATQYNIVKTFTTKIAKSMRNEIVAYFASAQWATDYDAALASFNILPGTREYNQQSNFTIVRMTPAEFEKAWAEEVAHRTANDL